MKLVMNDTVRKWNLEKGRPVQTNNVRDGKSKMNSHGKRI